MRLYADVNFNGRAIRELQRKGVDVLVAKEDGQGRTLDPDLLDRASSLGRVLCTTATCFKKQVVGNGKVFRLSVSFTLLRQVSRLGDSSKTFSSS